MRQTYSICSLSCGLLRGVYVFGAQVLLSLFIGVISTSMENATEEQKEEQLLEERIEKTAQRLFLSEERVEAMKYVFEQLDLDGGGTISEMELKIGLDAINANMEEEEIMDILQKVSPNGNEVDVNGFILFLYETRHCSPRATRWPRLVTRLSVGPA